MVTPSLRKRKQPACSSESRSTSSGLLKTLYLGVALSVVGLVFSQYPLDLSYFDAGAFRRSILNELSRPYTISDPAATATASLRSAAPARTSYQSVQKSFSQNEPLDEQRVTESPALDGAKKNRLILHVGPPKTATTSLQTDLTVLEHDLNSDGYEYAGRFYRSFVSPQGETITKREDSDLQKAAKSMFKKCHKSPRTKCVDGFLQKLQTYSHHQDQEPIKIVLSDESLAVWTPQDVRAFRDALPEDEWDVLVVIGYRHFYEWLPSSKFQRERIDRWSAFKSNWPGPGLQGLPLDPLLPHYLDQWREFHVYTDTLVETFQSGFAAKNVRILNLYEPTTVRTTFLCGIVPDAPHACRASQRLDREQGETLVNQIHDAPSSFYDSMATAAAARGLVDIHVVERRFIACDVKKYQEEVLQQSFMDFALKCPNDQELDSFLNESLRLEAKLMASSSEESILEHKQGFQTRAAANAFCWVDTDAALDSATWKEYFSRYSAPKYAAGLKYGWRCEEE